MSVGDHCRLGEDTWIDNLAPVTIGSHCCLSQGAYFCTGNHDWQSESFDRRAKPITAEDHAWIVARAVIASGVTVGEGAILSLGSVANKDLAQWHVHTSVPASSARPRRMKAILD